MRICPRSGLCFDTHAKGLAGYGKVDEGLSDELDPSMKELIDLVTQMKNLLLPKPARPQAEGGSRND